MILRVLASLFISIFIVLSDVWLPFIYKAASSEELHTLGALSAYLLPCDFESCPSQYKISLSDLKIAPQDRVLSLGSGRFFGSVEWYCESNGKFHKIYETGKVNGKSTSGEMFQYQVASLPKEICPDVVLVKAASTQHIVTGKPGWKSGALVLGPTSIVSAFKNVSDFFSSYIRALLGILVLLFVLFEPRVTKYFIPGLYWYKMGVILLSIHFIASSSILDVLIPGVGFLGFPLLKAGGTLGVLFLILALQERFKKSSKVFSAKRKNRSSVLVLMYFVAGVLFYLKFQGESYAFIQFALAVCLVGMASVLKVPTLLFTGLLLCIDLFAVYGFLPGFPTNVGMHFFIISYIYDSFEWTLRNNEAIEQIPNLSTLKAGFVYLDKIRTRFRLKRLSYSYFAIDGGFKTVLLGENFSTNHAFENESVPRLSASVMTARSPILRMNVDSEYSQKLKGKESSTTKNLGEEYCVFPMIYSERVIGTLNITGYSSWAISDSRQLFLFLSLLDKFIPKFSEILYRSDLSPNIDEEKKIFEVESSFVANQSKSKARLIDAVNGLSKELDIRVIISEKLSNEDSLLTYSNHNYFAEDARFLDTHYPRLSDTLVTSPANLAYLRNETVFVNNVEQMFPVYPEFLISLFTRNHTKSLYVSPVSFTGVDNYPWGVIWIEFGNKMLRPESDLFDLANTIVKSISRMMQSLFDFEAQNKVKKELGSLLPKRVLEKIEHGLNPREEEFGYLLNIDLVGSTKVAKSIGDVNFSLLISKINLELGRVLGAYGFHQQMIIWDAFIFTRAVDEGSLLPDVVKDLEMKLQSIFNDIKAIDYAENLSFRAVLHFGDITRDLSQGATKTWVIVGSALAESCKIEASIKHIKEQIFVSSEAQNPQMKKAS